jgi:hypothetical protein
MGNVAMRAGWATMVVTIALFGLPSSPVADSSADFPRESWAVWTVTTKSSSDRTPLTRRICINSFPQPEMKWWTCAGEVRAPEPYPPSNKALSCTDITGKHADSVTMWKNGLVARYAETNEIFLTGKPGGPKQKDWAETTMVYGGECPVDYKSDSQEYLVIDRNNAIVYDPNKTTDCMIGVLKSVEGVTDPKVRYVMSAGEGPLPYIEYTFPSRHTHDPTTIVFSPRGGANGDPSQPSFGTTLGGMFAPPDTGPDDYGTKSITKLWKERCSVDAGVMTV